MTRVDCDDCSMNFQTKKLYIKHLKSKECTKSKHAAASKAQGMPAAKKPRLDGQTNAQASLLTVGQQSSSQYSPKQMEVLQSQITQLSQKQKELLQAQITQKQRQVLQAIPYNQLSEKQKEILKRLSASKPASPIPPTTTAKQSVTPSPTFVQIRPNSAQGTVAASSQSKDSKVDQNAKRARKKSVNNKIPELKNGQIVKLSASGNTNSASKLPESDSKDKIITDFVFSEEPIEAESIEIAGEAVTMVAPTEFVSTELDLAVKTIVQNPLELDSDKKTPAEPPSKVGSLKIKSLANVFQDISNIVAPTATPKETCTICKKIFSKAGLQQHIESKHKIQCSYCELKFLEEELSVHRKEHLEPCSICKEIVVKTELDQHIEMNHKESCSFCSIKFMKTELNSHIRNIHEPEGCDECESRFESKELLGEHVVNVHLVEKCDECSSRFRTANELEAHVLEVHPKEYCEEDDCEAVFSTVKLLDEHKEKVHPNPNKFLSFNGGMFMMMMQVDEQEEDEEIVEKSEDEDNDTDETIRRQEDAEKAATYEFFHQLVVETADNVVKTAMTGKILFALRFDDVNEVNNEDEDSEVDEAVDSKDENMDGCSTSAVSNPTSTDL